MATTAAVALFCIERTLEVIVKYLLTAISEKRMLLPKGLYQHAARSQGTVA